MPTKITRGRCFLRAIALGARRAPAEGLICPTLTSVRSTTGPTDDPYQSSVDSYSLKNHAHEVGRVPFLVGAAIMASVAIYAAWRPGSVFDNVRIEHHELPIDVLASVTLARLNNEVRV